MGKIKYRIEYAKPAKTVKCPRCHLEFDPVKARQDSAIGVFVKNVAILVLVCVIAASIIRVAF